MKQWKIMKKMWIFFAMVVICCGLFTSCKMEQTATDKIGDIDYTVVEDADLPEELKEIIEEKKESEFKLSYAKDSYLYIVVGYGIQQTGGYSISVDDLYETENSVFMKTTLIGPSEQEEISKAATYPYVVVKMEFLDKDVVYE